jgi:hypothetical protein
MVGPYVLELAFNERASMSCPVGGSQAQPLFHRHAGEPRQPYGRASRTSRGRWGWRTQSAESFGDHAAQQRGTVGHNSVDAHAPDEPAHLVLVIDRPDVHSQPGGLGGRKEPVVHNRASPHEWSGKFISGRRAFNGTPILTPLRVEPTCR